jgi:hypothetical protein
MSFKFNFGAGDGDGGAKQDDQPPPERHRAPALEYIPSAQQVHIDGPPRLLRRRGGGEFTSAAALATPDRPAAAPAQGAEGGGAQMERVEVAPELELWKVRHRCAGQGARRGRSRAGAAGAAPWPAARWRRAGPEPRAACAPTSWRRAACRAWLPPC